MHGDLRAYLLGSRRVLGRAWAFWCRDEDSESQVDTRGRCLSLGRAGTPLGGMGQAKQTLVGRSDPGHWTQSGPSESQAGCGCVLRNGSALSFLPASSGHGDWSTGDQRLGGGTGERTGAWRWEC